MLVGMGHSYYWLDQGAPPPADATTHMLRGLVSWFFGTIAAAFAGLGRWLT